MEVSADGYVYVRIPSNIKSECPSLGISCHLDVTPEAKGGNIKPIVDLLNGHTVVRTDGSTLLGADDKCGVTIAVELIRTVLLTPTIKHGNLFFVFCPNEDVGRAADKIDATAFCPDILFDLDGEEFGVITKSNLQPGVLMLNLLDTMRTPAMRKLKIWRCHRCRSCLCFLFPGGVPS